MMWSLKLFVGYILVP